MFLSEYYKLIIKNRNLKRSIYNDLLKNKKIKFSKIKNLEEFKNLLTELTDSEYKCNLFLDDKNYIPSNLFYEITELEKDLIFLKTNNLFDYYNHKYTFFEKELREIKTLLKDEKINLFITDRDGTINNYCSRYRSCIQSIYNAYYLYNFIKFKTKKAIMITSAPLIKPGILDSVLDTNNLMVYGASKGREFLDHNGKVFRYPISKIKEKVLAEFNLKLKQLLKKREYKNLELIGSGLQLKFGQTTIARQDISGSIDKNLSTTFLNEIKFLISEINKKDTYLKLEDTGTDLEIILTIDGLDKDFDKSAGLDFISKKLKLNYRKGLNLICGDTSSDIPMLEYSLSKSPNTYAIFVNSKSTLKAKVKSLNKNALFVSSPDVLVQGLYNISRSKE